MNEYINVLLDGWLITSIIFGIYIISVIANTVLSLFFNITITHHESFQFSRLLLTFVKGLIIYIGTLLLTITVVTIPYVFNNLESFKSLDIHIGDDVVELVTIGTIVLIYKQGIIKYTIEAKETLDNIINSTNK